MIRSLLKRIFAVIFSATPAFCLADEGMWLPNLLKLYNEERMTELGMRITAEDIYSINRSSIKDAIVIFGGGCTGEVISADGLLLTNHHCGFDQIRQHSSVEKDYLKNGFWAMSREEELPNENLSVTFIRRIEDVTAQVLEGVTDKMNTKRRDALIRANKETVEKNASIAPSEHARVHSFYKDNQYYLIVTETFDDVRLVGAPPSSIGKFGADTDNWAWPRHSGDFALFRIYADKDNRPAAYSADNVPYKAPYHLPISTQGFEDGDFTFVYGFPGRTDQYLPAVAVEMVVDQTNPARIAMRDAALAVLKKEMAASDTIRIQYASIQATLANAWKKWIGESQGLKRTKAVAHKKAYEADFMQRIAQSDSLKEAYGSFLPRLNELYASEAPYSLGYNVFNELYGSLTAFQMANRYFLFARNKYKDSQKTLEQLEELAQAMNLKTDKALFEALLKEYFRLLPCEFVGKETQEILESYQGDYALLANAIYASALLDSSRFPALFENRKALKKAVKDDVFYRFFTSLRNDYINGILPLYHKYATSIAQLQRVYMKAQMEVMKDRVFYPDANFTMRVTYGQVGGIDQVRDAVSYKSQTFLEGVMEKYVPGDYEFDVHPKLIELYNNKDFGPYAQDGKMPVAFIASNHTSGGNSGSPALNADGNLIGLNFDRLWEGTMSDIYYQSSICRNIMVDIRYILFIIDKFAGAKHLIDEMTILP